MECFFPLLAAMMLLKAQEARKILQLPLLLVAFFATFAAVLSKQIFLTSTLPLIFLMCASKKYWRGLIVPVLVAVVYLPYVHFLTGLDYNYSPSTVATSQIAQYIHRGFIHGDGIENLLCSYWCFSNICCVQVYKVEN